MFVIINIIYLTHKNKDINYNFLNVINNWNIVYNNYSFLNYNLQELNNKIIAPKIIKSIGIKTPKIYYHGNINNVNKDIFKKKAYIIKPENGHSSNNVFLINNSINIFDGKKYNYNDFKKIFNYTKKNNNVIIEEYILNYNSFNKYGINDDFKVYTFKGTPELILHKFYENNKYYCCWYDSSLNIINRIRISNDYDSIIKQKYIDKKYLRKLLDTVKYVGNKIFIDVFVRLDFYLDNNFNFVFGEVTPRPCSGICFTPNGIKLLNQLSKKHKLHYKFL